MRARWLVFGSSVLAGVALAVACAAEPPEEDALAAASVAPRASASTQTGAAALPTRPAASSESTAPAVSASSARPAQAHDDGAPRVHAKTRFVWIRREPDSGTEWIGFLWSGGSTKLKSSTPRPGPGCETWYEVEPRGFVCVDGRRATLDASDPVLAALREHGPDLNEPEPHRYGESIGLQRYSTLPSVEIQRARERGFDAHWERVVQARSEAARDESLAGIDVALPEAAPPAFPELHPAVHEGRRYLLRRSTVAWTREARSGDRGFLLAGDYTWVPKDRVKPYPPVTFRGTALGKGKSLPLAFFRGEDRPAYRRSAEGFEAAAETFVRLGFVGLTDESVEWNDERYLATERDGLWVKEKDAVVPKPRSKTPWGDEVGSGTRASEVPAGRRSWLEVSILGGWLIAYEDTTPVYVTMISAGRGGEPVKGRPTLETASTPTGSYSINGKFATATMEAPGEFVHSDVPWVQNFVGPYALHAAYWHDNWGKLMSAGCVNVSPGDGKWLYEFTDPKVPEGWHGVRWLPKVGPTTMIVIHG